MKFHLANLQWIKWSIFLGTSWTWCIGMFLPVLLIRDLGVWGWIVFAVPNVVGAAAMGWVLKDPDQSRRVVQQHQAACSAFSVVTIAFHVFFVLWFVPRLVGLPSAAIAFALVALYLVASAARPNWDGIAAIIVWVFSLAMMGWFVSAVHSEPVTFAFPASGVGAVWLTPVCVLGFLFCPYLDLTFHRARQALDRDQARLAFGAGFGVCFLSMIVFTLIYATRLMPLLGSDWQAHIRPAFGAAIASHMIAQAALTLAFHTRSLLATDVKPGGIFVLAIVAQITIFLALAVNLLPRYAGFDAGEIVYRLFMSFYGLLAPAYVWLCVVPGRDGRSGMTEAKLRTLVLTIALATPCFWLGFIHDRFVWLLPGCAIVLAARFLAPDSTAQRVVSVESR